MDKSQNFCHFLNKGQVNDDGLVKSSVCKARELGKAEAYFFVR